MVSENEGEGSHSIFKFGFWYWITGASECPLLRNFKFDIEMGESSSGSSNITLVSANDGLLQGNSNPTRRGKASWRLNVKMMRIKQLTENGTFN
jgi:hypothetical protein